MKFMSIPKLLASPCEVFTHPSARADADPGSLKRFTGSEHCEAVNFFRIIEGMLFHLHN